MLKSRSCGSREYLPRALTRTRSHHILLQRLRTPLAHSNMRIAAVESVGVCMRVSFRIFVERSPRYFFTTRACMQCVCHAHCSVEQERRAAALQQEALRTYLLKLQAVATSFFEAFPSDSSSSSTLEGAASPRTTRAGWSQAQIAACSRLGGLLEVSFGGDLPVSSSSSTTTAASFSTNTAGGRVSPAAVIPMSSASAPSRTTGTGTGTASVSSSSNASRDSDGRVQQRGAAGQAYGAPSMSIHTAPSNGQNLAHRGHPSTGSSSKFSTEFSNSNGWQRQQQQQLGSRAADNFNLHQQQQQQHAFRSAPQPYLHSSNNNHGPQMYHPADGISSSTDRSSSPLPSPPMIPDPSTSVRVSHDPRRPPSAALHAHTAVPHASFSVGIQGGAPSQPSASSSSSYSNYPLSSGVNSTYNPSPHAVNYGGSYASQAAPRGSTHQFSTGNNHSSSTSRGTSPSLISGLTSPPYSTSSGGWSTAHTSASSAAGGYSDDCSSGQQQQQQWHANSGSFGGPAGANSGGFGPAGSGENNAAFGFPPRDVFPNSDRRGARGGNTSSSSSSGSRWDVAHQ